MSEEKKPYHSSLSSRIWKIGSLTTSVSKNIIEKKIKKTVFNEEDENILDPKVIDKIVKTLSELKGPWMKLGQYLSMHEGYISEDILESFSTLQYKAPSMSFYFTKGQIKKEFGKEPDLIFRKFSRKPIGSASIGQVHIAYLKSGEKVAVKVQYPDMEKIIKSDLTTLKISLAPLRLIFQKKIEPLIDEVKNVLIQELNYEQEAKNIDRFKNLKNKSDNVVIPNYYKEYSTNKVLTMEYIEGIALEEAIKSGDLTQESKDKLGFILLDTLWNQLLNNNIIHADPHPGNFLYLENDRLAILDFGCIKTFQPEFVDNYKHLLTAMVEKDIDKIKKTYIDFGFIDETQDEKLDALVEFSLYMAAPYHKDDFFDINENMKLLENAPEQFKKVSQKLGLVLPKEFIFLNRTLFGIGMLLIKLKVKLNFHKILTKYLYKKE